MATVTPLTNASAKALLFDKLLRDELGDGLLQVLERLTAAGMSTRQIAARLHKWTGQPIAHRTVHTWLRTLEHTEED